MTHINDGIYNDLPNADYHSSDAISKSMLDQINKGIAHYQWNQNAPKTEQDFLSLGTLIHCAVLEPTELYNRYAVMPKFDLRTKDGKAEKARFELENEGKICLDADTSDKAQMMQKSVLAHPIAKELLDDGVAEISVFNTDEETGLQFKVRPDWYNEKTKTIVDLKTTSNFNDFVKSIYDYRYHVQASFYKKVMNSVFGEGHKFYFIVVSTTLNLGKYPVTVIELNDDWQNLGDRDTQRNIDQFANYKELKAEIETVDMPYFIKSKLEQQDRNNAIIPASAW